jgi:hypothetical protein
VSNESKAEAKGLEMKSIQMVTGMVLALVTVLVAGFEAQAETPAGFVPIKVVRASSEREGAPARNVSDGDHTDDSRWLSAPNPDPQWIELELPETKKLIGLHLHTGFKGQQPITDFKVQFKSGDEWVDIPSADVTGNEAAVLALQFDDTVDVVSDTLRIWITRTPNNTARISGIVVWSDAIAEVPPLRAPVQEPQRTPSFLFLNQAGFNAGAPKRFTAPLADDNTAFAIVPAEGGEPVFSGVIKGNIGDVTAFEPVDNREYKIIAGEHESVPFRVAPRLLEQLTYQLAIDFMVDSRQYIGNTRSASVRSYAWRDDHAFAWQLHTLVPQWLSNPDAYRNMRRQVVYEADPRGGRRWGALEPPQEDAPDIVKLIHWGADIIVTKSLSHEFFKAQLAYFLYAWPSLQDYLPKQNYDAVLAYAFAEWANPEARRNYPYCESPEHNLLALKTHIGHTKGTYPPGFSVQPNLMMYEVAKRENRPDAEIYFKAAYDQAAWMIETLDWNNPLNTKGQRVSEFITMTGLAHFLQAYPDRAPAGLREKINAWADVVVHRSDNLWDFRKLSDDQWVPTGPRPTMWNEPGNVMGLPAAIFAAMPFLDAAPTRDRLQQIAWSHFDNMFGRNPVGRHFGYRAHEEIEGVEHGWFSRHRGGIGRLENVRFALDGSPKNIHYPFNPSAGNRGWTEAWVQHNVNFNISLAYLARATNKLTLDRSGNELAVRLEAPVNFEADKPGEAHVKLVFADGKAHLVQLKESSPRSGILTGSFSLQNAPRTGKVIATYGFGFMQATTEINL